jgi:hypothetical protein
MKEAFAVKRNLENLLTRFAEGRYEVRDEYRKTDAGDLLRCPQVTVEYKSGRFPESVMNGGGLYTHDATLEVMIAAAAASEMDLTPLKEGGTTGEVLDAYAGRQDAYLLAGKRIDDTAALLFDIILRPQHRELDGDYDAGRWIPDFTKGGLEESGGLIFRAARFTVTIQVPEYTTGEQGTPGETIAHQVGVTTDTAGVFTDGEGITIQAPRPTISPPGRQEEH